MTKHQEQELRVRKELSRFGVSSIGVYTNKGKTLVGVHGELEQDVANGKEYLRTVNEKITLL